MRLDAEADPASNFVTYWSEGIAQLDRTYPGTSNQPFWSTTDPSRTYNSNFDFFPNDRAMRFGELTYDDAGLASGSGVVEIEGLTLGIEFDPTDPSYVNGSWLSFSTELQEYSGSVTVVNGAATEINLTATYTSTGSFGAEPIDASGTFVVSGDRFTVMASGYNPNFGDYNPSLAWDWTGVILGLELPQVDNADFNSDGFVDAADYTLWRDNLGTVGVPAYTLGDADGDSQVTTTDYEVWKSQYGAPPPALVAVTGTAPEPSALAAVAVSVVAALVHRRTAAALGRRR
ncbi:hypothetical protein KOR34_15120 [Posidoniimonas corsicana]|uniref:Dockerin domain-containing protein n=1 Tax=Posidoniimonas corsicana TaxID=1938618 RepID=A0A5C5VDC5_9BACT|nr:hypothetical protein [Posidoniimonas corsicana]TWT36606.1 hypothetical protein KOR34_15120 [Posidoniimonas corsicana]